MLLSVHLSSRIHYPLGIRANGTGRPCWAGDLEGGVAILLFRGTTLEQGRYDSHFCFTASQSFCLEGLLWNSLVIQLKDSVIESQSFCLEGLLWNLADPPG